MRIAILAVVMVIVLTGVSKAEDVFYNTLTLNCTGKVVKAWAGRERSLVWSGSQVIKALGNSSDEVLFICKTDTDGPNDALTFSSYQSDKKDIEKFYMVHKDVWIPTMEDKLEDRVQVKPKEEVQVVINEKTGEAIPVIEKMQSVYTYEVKRVKGDDMKYYIAIIRSDGVEVIKMDTESSAKKLIPFLK